jgi:Xaa-Pro aminopeptidase
MAIEFDKARDEILRREMRSAGLSSIIGRYPEDLVMMAGTWPCLGMNLCLYPAEGQPVYYMSPNEPEDVCPPGFALRRFAIDPGQWAELRALLMADIARLGIADRDIGTAADGGQHAVTSFSGETPLFGAAAMSRILDGLRVRDATALFVAAGLRKTPLEAERIRRASTVAGAGLSVFHEELRAGRSEAEIAAMVEAAIQSRSGKDGCSLARAWAHVQAGRNIHQGGTFSRSSAYRLLEGDLVLIELGTCVDGYWSDLTRTACVGRIGDRQRALLTAVKGAQAAAIAAVRPGTSHEDIDRVARDFLEERDFGAGFTHNCGHHVGFRYHDRGPALQKGSAAPLEQGMVVTVEPGSYGAEFGGGARFEDDVLVTDGGGEVLSPRHISWEP